MWFDLTSATASGRLKRWKEISWWCFSNYWKWISLQLEHLEQQCWILWQAIGWQMNLYADLFRRQIVTMRLRTIICCIFLLTNVVYLNTSHLSIVLFGSCYCSGEQLSADWNIARHLNGQLFHHSQLVNSITGRLIETFSCWRLRSWIHQQRYMSFGHSRWANREFKLSSDFLCVLLSSSSSSNTLPGWGRSGEVLFID